MKIFNLNDPQSCLRAFKSNNFFGLIIFIMSTIIANIYDPLLGITYAFGNILTLTFLSWLYKETWSDPRK